MALNKKYSRTSRNVAILDDDPHIREYYHLQLQCAGFHSIMLQNLSELYDLITKNPIEIILLDNFLKNESGISAIPEIMKLAPKSRVIVLTKSSSPDHVVEAIKNGAYDFISKDSGVRKIINKIRTCCPPVSSSSTFSFKPFLDMGFIGTSKVMHHLFQDIEKVSKHDINILISGETRVV